MSGAEEWSGAERIVRCMSEPGVSEYESQVLAKSQVLKKKVRCWRKKGQVRARCWDLCAGGAWWLRRRVLSRKPWTGGSCDQHSGLKDCQDANRRGKLIQATNLETSSPHGHF